MHTKIISFITFILFLNSCNKEISFIDSFPFEVSVTGNKEILLSETLNSQITIKPEGFIEGNSYTFTYFSEGKGVYSINGNIIPEGQNHELDSLVQKLTYIPIVEGNHNINFNFEDSNGNFEKSEINYIIFKDSTDFDFTFETFSEINTVGSRVNIILDIVQTDDQPLTYLIDIRGHNGELFLTKKEFIPGQVIINRSGRYNLSFVPTKVSNNDLIVTLFASNRIKKTKRIKFKSLPVEFDFDFSNKKIFFSEAKINELVSIILDRPTFGKLAIRPNYYLTIQTTTDNIFLQGRYGFGSIIPLNEFSGITNENFTYSFVRSGKVIGGEITFTIKNDTGFKISKSITVEEIE